ncbi:phospholipase D-like domain-containing protein [Sphingomonas paeninsulae]|uniref:phospholipase D-like domain-containing protein n=1 Tax=Sphingomonas paeninsulae TaxID=2319844 RepID=UPI001EF0243C|nr:phospholipase D-like domain-containing protein [Sphingomonas paeninsulae]
MSQTGAVWRTEHATRASIIVDACDYFRIARTAMLKARQRIMLVGWDFDARITLTEERCEDGGPETVGEFIYWLVERNPKLEVYLLRWDTGALGALFRGTTVLTVVKWMRHPRIHTKLDGHHPTGGSHHQKIMVIDDCFAFCGGIDMTGNRWDTREHLDDEAGRVGPGGKPYKPWHDATSALQGPVAAALGDLCRDRWQRAGCAALLPIESEHDCWPDNLNADFTDIDISISRTVPEMADQRAVTEIEQLYVAQIARAKHMIYAESQYFASRRIAEAIAARLGEDDCPEIVIINPMTAEGWLQPVAMDSARARLLEALRRRDRNARLRMYHPLTEGGQQIYVHAKILIIDDQILRIGSSNFNNRSMRLDTECDITIDATVGHNTDRVAVISSVRDGLIAEHLGIEAGAVTRHLQDHGSLFAVIDTLNKQGRLKPFEQPDLSAVEKWLADNEVLDPEGPAQMFEVRDRGGLFRNMFGRH